MAVAGAAWGWPAQGQPGYGTCAQIANATERLACYDRLSRAPQMPAAPPRAADQVQGFGAESLPPAAPVRVARIRSPIQDFSVSPSGHFIVTLGNRQVWRQTESDNVLAHFHRGRTLSATVSRGALGSYNLVFNDRRVVYKVVRIR